MEEMKISVRLSRCPNGLRVRAKTHPAIEEFFRESASGERIDTVLWGRLWRPKDPTVSLQVYSVPTELSSNHFLTRRASVIEVAEDKISGYTLDKVSARLYDPSDRVINMSWLRLVGISEGIQFDIPGVYSEGDMILLETGLTRCSVRFFEDYLKPVNVNIVIATMPKEELNG